MEKENVGAVVVTEADRPVGIIIDRNIASAVCVRGMTPQERSKCHDLPRIDN